MKYPESFQDEELHKKWMELKKIRDICNISIEEKRASKEIGSSLEANLSISVNNEQSKFIENVDLAELCITSEVNIIKTNDKEIKVKTKKAEGKKCPICWKISKDECQRHTG